MINRVFFIFMVVLCFTGCLENKPEQFEKIIKGEDMVLSDPKPTENMIYVESGTFIMGDTIGDNVGASEKPVHTVTVSSFYLASCTTTQKEWINIMGSNPSVFNGEKLPVEIVSWYSSVKYCNKRSEKEGLVKYYNIDEVNKDANNTNIEDTLKWIVTMNKNANGYRLPTEAEWEYAAKGGNKARGYKYSGSDSAENIAWYTVNSGEKTHEVGTKKANELGLYDMSGNVWQWCWDWDGNYKEDGQINPEGNIFGSDRIMRGGAWNSSQINIRVSSRFHNKPNEGNSNVGFRVARSRL